MRVLHLSTLDNLGGVARATYRLHSGLRQLDQDSYIFVARRNSDDPSVTQFMPPFGLPSRFSRLPRQERITRSFARYRALCPAVYERFSDDRTMHGGDPVSQLPPCDVMNLHWFADFIDYQPFFPLVPNHISVAWTLHDMNPFTGGCHYDHGCDRFGESCGTRSRDEPQSGSGVRGWVAD